MARYIKNECFGGIKRRVGDSMFWTGLLHSKDKFIALCKFRIGNGRSTRFWEDWWLGSRPLKLQFPILYDICFNKNISVAAACGG